MSRRRSLSHPEPAVPEHVVLAAVLDRVVERSTRGTRPVVAADLADPRGRAHSDDPDWSIVVTGDHHPTIAAVVYGRTPRVTDDLHTTLARWRGRPVCDWPSPPPAATRATADADGHVMLLTADADVVWSCGADGSGGDDDVALAYHPLAHLDVLADHVAQPAALAAVLEIYDVLRAEGMPSAAAAAAAALLVDPPAAPTRVRTG